MTLSKENDSVLIRKAANRLLIMRCRNELTARLERLAKSHNEVPDLIQGKIVVRFIPKANQGPEGITRSKHQRTYHETFLAVRQVGERKSNVLLSVGKPHH